MTPRSPSLASALAASLLIGTALMGIGALLHPVLRGGAAEQLRMIAATPGWRAIHLAMLAGTALVIAGIWVRVIRGVRQGLPALLASLAVIAIGLALNGLNIAYMAGAGLHKAERFGAGDAAMALVFEATHPIGLMAARFGNLLVALGAITLGWAEWADGAAPRFVALLAWLAGIGGLAGVVLVSEHSPLVLGAVALLSGWQIVTGVRAFAPLVERTIAADRAG